MHLIIVIIELVGIVTSGLLGYLGRELCSLFEAHCSAEKALVCLPLIFAASFEQWTRLYELSGWPWEEGFSLVEAPVCMSFSAFSACARSSSIFFSSESRWLSSADAVRSPRASSFIAYGSCQELLRHSKKLPTSAKSASALGAGALFWSCDIVDVVQGRCCCGGSVARAFVPYAG